MTFTRNIFFSSLLATCAIACAEVDASKNNVLKTPVVYDSFEEMEWIFNQENDTTYVINFWATWCKPCVEELPFFKENCKHYDALKLVT